MVLAQILSYNPGMLESCEIHTKLGCTLVLKSLEMPHQMGYLNKSYEAVPHKSMNLPIVNV